MANRVGQRGRFTGAVLVVGLGLLCLLAGYVWWSTRLSRALTKLVDQQQQTPVGSRVEPIPAEWLPDLAWELVRDPSHIEEVCAWIEDALPQAMLGSPRLNSVAVRRNRYAAGLMTGRRPEEVLPALEGVFPRASTFTASWTE